jgi:hypothetical protein
MLDIVHNSLMHYWGSYSLFSLSQIHGPNNINENQRWLIRSYPQKNNDKVDKSHVYDMEPLANHHWLFFMSKALRVNTPYPDPDITTTNHETPPFASQNDCPTFIIEETCNHPRLTQPQHMYKCYWLAWHKRLMRTWRPHIYHVPLSKAIM